MNATLLFRIINAARAVDATHFDINSTVEKQAHAWTELCLARRALEDALVTELPEIKVETTA